MLTQILIVDALNQLTSFCVVLSELSAQIVADNLKIIDEHT